MLLKHHQYQTNQTASINPTRLPVSNQRDYSIKGKTTFKKSVLQISKTIQTHKTIWKTIGKQYPKTTNTQKNNNYENDKPKCKIKPSLNPVLRCNLHPKTNTALVIVILVFINNNKN